MRASEHVDPVNAPLPPSAAVGGDDDDWETKEPTAVPLVAAASNANSGNTNAATEAFGRMRLTPPPPAQDGGAYERTPQAQPNAFDSSSAYAQPVSAATASAASALNGGGAPMDPVLVACLDNPRERLTLLKFEDQIVRFIRSSREPQLIFPPLSSYHRLIIHRLAERCCLEHQTADYNPYAQHGGYDGNSARVVTLFKTPQSIVPSVLLIDLSADRQQPMVTPASAPKIMVRKRGATRPGANGGRGGNGQDAKNAQRTMQDREKAYAEARARIFGEDSTAATDGTSSSSSTTSSSSPATATEPSSSGGVKFNSQQASGPDGSRGFGGRGRGRGATSDKSTTPQRQDRSEAEQSQSSSSASSTRAVAVQNTQNWKESKVLWRNREQELNDPDFTRNHDAYRPSRNHNGNGSQRYNAPPPSQQHGVNRYPLPSQQQLMDYYDGSSQHRPPYSGGGYNQQQQPPPLPGRRFPTGEFNRLDHTGIPPQRSPPPPPDHFRGGHQHIHQPPGRGYTSPHNRHHQQYPNNNFRSHGGSESRHGGGGYNDDFPPLGGK
ncbi:Mrna-binding protein encore, partial [Globisporangium splendens]